MSGMYVFVLHLPDKRSLDRVMSIVKLECARNFVCIVDVDLDVIFIIRLSSSLIKMLRRNILFM
jgi:hypothetical protein